MRRVGAAASLLVVVAMAAGCGTQSRPVASTTPPGQPGSASSAAPPQTGSTTVRRFDPHWMTLATSPSWTESNRRITGEFRQFGLRPVDETELPRGCNGCGFQPPTAYVTVYSTGEFDPAQARSGEPVKVNSDNDGYFSPSEGSEDAVLAWQYADDSWATVRGTTTRTSQPDLMLELARAVRPGDLTAIRLPLSVPDVPASMPLAEINVDRGRYGTTVVFAGCAADDEGRVLPCQVESDSLRMHIWPTDDPAGHIPPGDSVPAQIGGRPGTYGADGKSAAVQVRSGMLTVFDLSGTAPPLKDILATLTWAPDPGDERTWRPVADWSEPA